MTAILSIASDYRGNTEITIPTILVEDVCAAIRTAIYDLAACDCCGNPHSSNDVTLEEICDWHGNFGDDDLTDETRELFGQFVVFHDDRRVTIDITGEGIGTECLSVVAPESTYYDSVCVMCYEDYYSECQACSEVMHCDDSHYCEDCCESFCSYCHNEHMEENHNEDEGEFDVMTPDVKVPGKIVRSTRLFGVEMEQDGYNASRVVSEMQAAGNWLSGHHSEHCGHEFVTRPMSGADAENGVRTMLEILSSNGYAPNSSCGTHFHLDMSNEDDATLWRIAAAFRIVETLLFSLADDRVTSQWCGPSTQTMPSYGIEAFLSHAENGLPFRSYVQTVQDTRYSAINLHAYGKHSTIEIRVLDGFAQNTPDRILHSVAFMAGIADYVSANPDLDLSVFVGQPHALAFTVAKAGHFSGATLDFVTGRAISTGQVLRRTLLAAEMRNAADAAYRAAYADFTDARRLAEAFTRTANVDARNRAAALRAHDARLSARAAEIRNELRRIEDLRYNLSSDIYRAEEGLRPTGEMLTEANTVERAILNRNSEITRAIDAFTRSGGTRPEITYADILPA